MKSFCAILLAALLFRDGGSVAALAASRGGSPAESSAITIPPGQIDRAVTALDRLAPELLRTTGVPGMAIAVVHDDKVVYAKGFGYRRVGAKERVDKNTIFQLASVSKPLAATVVAKYLPGFTLSDPYVGSHVTIADMFAHRSGLPDHAGDLLEDLGYDRATIVRRLALEPLAPFRISYAYTNFGLTSAAQAVADAARVSWETLSRRVLYEPAGMHSTSSRFADYQNAPDKAAQHVRIGSTWVAKFTTNADAQAPAGGASSSVSDMAKWLRLELADGKFDGKQIVDEDALLETRRPAVVSAAPPSAIGRASFYGLGMNVSYDEAGRLRLGHSGAFNLGAATAITMLPSANLGIVVLSNGMPIGVPETIVAEFIDLVEFRRIQRDWFAAYSPLFARLYVNPSRLAGKKPPANPVHMHSRAAYIGTYANAFYGAVSIEFMNGRLVMVLGPRLEAFPLEHWSANTFSYVPSGENAVGVSAVTFTMGPAGHAETVTVENLNADKLGTFRRK
jgi:CubicO group peptidase (beta-lactamase class C family)